MRTAGYILLLLVAAAAVAAAVAASVALLVLADTALYDTNYAVFERLAPADRAGIFRTATQLASFHIFLLVATNLLWAFGMGAVLRHGRVRPRALEKLTAAIDQDGPDR
jgi:hypothetical protein